MNTEMDENSNFEAKQKHVKVTDIKIAENFDSSKNDDLLKNLAPA